MSIQGIAGSCPCSQQNRPQLYSADPLKSYILERIEEASPYLIPASVMLDLVGTQVTTAY